MTSEDERAQELVNDFVERKIDRRQFLQRSAALGLTFGAASALLAACGGDEEAAPPAEPAPAEPAPAEPTPPAEPAATEPAATGAAEAEGPLRSASRSTSSTSTQPSIRATSRSSRRIGVYEGLITYKPGTWEVVNVLAETFEPSADGLQFAFKLKEGIQFHGGYGELTAEDVKFSFERTAGLTKPAIESPYKGDWVALQEVQVTDTYSGTIILKEPFSALMSTTLPVYSGLVLSKKAVEERGEEYATSPIGTGPYEFVEWKPKQHVRVQRFADYGGASSDFLGTLWDELVFIPIEEDNAVSIALETGEVDFAQLGLSGVSEFEDNDDFTLHERVSLDYNWIGMNMRNPKLEDINVRQAIRYAVDVPAILEAAFEGRYEQATAILPPGMPIGYWEDAPLYERDLEKAQEFLAMASNPPTELEFKFTEETGATATAEIVQANLAEHRDHRDAQQAGLVGLLRAREGRAPEPRALLCRLHHEPGSLLVDRVVHLRPDRRLELDVLVRRGVRPAAQRGAQGERPGCAQRHVHRDAEALGRGRAHGLARLADEILRGSPGHRADAPAGRSHHPDRVPCRIALDSAGATGGAR